MVCMHLIEGLEKRRYIEVTEYTEVTAFGGGTPGVLGQTRKIVACDPCLEEAKVLNHKRQHAKV
jgi:hypothetical protein